MRVLLGRHPIAEADVSALPALMTLCRALGTPAEWDPIGEVLYINPPLAGKRLRVETGHDEALGRALKDRLRPLGAEIVSTGDADAALRIVVVRKRSAQVSAVHSWPGSDAARRLANLLAEHVAEECGLSLGPVRPALTARLGSGSAAGLIVTHADSGDFHLARWVAEGICRALLAFWSPDAESDMPDSLPEPDPYLEVVTESVLPTSPDPYMTPDGQDEPRLILDADPSLVPPVTEEPVLAMVASVDRPAAPPPAEAVSEPAAPTEPAPAAPVQANLGGPRRLPGLPGSMKPVARSAQPGRSTRSRFGKQGDPRLVPGVVDQSAFRWGDLTAAPTSPYQEAQPETRPEPHSPPPPPVRSPVQRPRSERVERQQPAARVIHHGGTIISYISR